MSEEFDFAASPITPGISVIEASAGTGKTFAISHLVPRLLLDGTVSRISEILLVTFTNDAARELCDRTRRVLEHLIDPPSEADEPGVAKLRQQFPNHEQMERIIGTALLDIDRLNVSTIHSFCQRTLQNEGPLCGLPVTPELIPNASELTERILHDLWEREIASDALASEIATAQGWNLSADRVFLEKALPLENPIAVPDFRPFHDDLDELETLARQVTPDLCEELARELDNVVHWKSGRESSHAAHARHFATFRSAAEPGFLNAAAAILDAIDSIHGNKHRGLAKRLCELEIARIARRIADVLAGTNWNFRWEMLEKTRGEIRNALSAGRQITYDGLISALVEALRGDHARRLAGRLRAQYLVALIDESQDTDSRQFEIFRKLFVGFAGEDPLPTHRLILIGDPKQAIYAFRGADVNTYLEARRLAANRLFGLTRTYRAPQTFVDGINTIFQRDGTFLRRDLPFSKAGSGLAGDVQLVDDNGPSASRLEAWCVAGDDRYQRAAPRLETIAATVASEIVRLLNTRARIVTTDSSNPSREKLLLPGDIAVLVNKHHEGDVVATALRERNVPAIRASRADIMATDEARELLAILSALESPRRADIRRAALATRLAGFDLAAIHALDSEADEETLQFLLDWRMLWRDRGIATAISALVGHWNTNARLALQPEGERRIANLRQLTDLLQQASLDLHHHPGHVLRWFRQEISRASDRTDVDERQQQLETDAEAVQIVTMHASKGLEFPLVFCPFLWSSSTPGDVQILSDPDRGTLVIETGLTRDENPRIAREALEDRLRLAYVALTRAKVKAWVYAGDVCSSRAAPSPLDWLLREEGITHDDWLSTAKDNRSATHRKTLKQLAEASGGAIAVVPPPPITPAKRSEERDRPDEVLHSRPAPAIPQAWRLTSFSALTREKNRHADAPVLTVDDEATGSLFAGLPGGTLVGTAIHDWMEQWDFAEPDLERLTGHLASYSLPESHRFPAATQEMLRTLTRTRLSGMDCTVGDACTDPRASEWHFQLPISQSLSAQKLARVFADHGEEEYAALLAGLPVEELAGYLHGFLDRIAIHGNRWGVIDWKTNDLGPRPDDYAQPALVACAHRSHYLLQAHLYLVALRRHLGPGTPIAGAWLVFLRGIRAGTADGVLHIRPGDALMSALDELFAQPASR